MYRLLTLLAFVLALSALALGAQTPRAHSEEARQWTAALNEQLKLDDVKNADYLVVIFCGVGVREDEARAIRDHYATALSARYGTKVSVVALPTYAGKGGGIVDVLVRSMVRHFTGGYPAHVAEALERIAKDNPDRKIVGVGCHSGAGYPCNDESSDIIAVLKRHPDQFISGLKILFLNTNLRNLVRSEYENAGVTAKQVRYDFVTWVTTAGTQYFPFGEYLANNVLFLPLHPYLQSAKGLSFAAAAIVGIFDLLLDRHSITTATAVEEVLAELGLSEILPEVPEDEEATATAVPPGPFWPECPPFCPPFLWGGGGGPSAQPTPPPAAGCPPVCPPCPPICPPGAGPGGVDLSSVELRYLTEFADSSISGRIFGAALSGDRAQPGQGIDLERATELSSSSFFVWLTLPDSTFWVNLNPDEPDRIIDPRLGGTDVGRIMLEADLQMKKDIARLTHPDTAEGKAFWDELYAVRTPGSGIESEGSISVNFRVWIVPGEVKVFADDRQIYVVDAALDVKLEAEYAKALAGGEAPGQPESDDNSATLGEAEEVLKRMILPKLVDEVNTAPQYQELRQIFYSRVLAQWYKSNAQVDELAFRGLVDQGKLELLQSHEPWSPQDIYQRYLTSVTQGEYRITRETREEHETYVETRVETFFDGGVDLTIIPVSRISFDQLLAERPDAEKQLQHALTSPGYRSDSDNKLWIGGLFVVNTAGLPGIDVPQIRAIGAGWQAFLN